MEHKFWNQAYLPLHGPIIMIQPLLPSITMEEDQSKTKSTEFWIQRLKFVCWLIIILILHKLWIVKAYNPIPIYTFHNMSFRLTEQFSIINCCPHIWPCSLTRIWFSTFLKQYFWSSERRIILNIFLYTMYFKFIIPSISR